MGSVFSKKVEPKDELATVVEKIRDVDQAILDLHQEEYKVSNIFMVGILVGVSAIGIKFVMNKPGTNLGVLLGVLIILIILLYVIFRIFLKKCYNYRTSRQAKQKSILSQRRSEILKEIKEKVPFKEARELILKYGTEDDLTSDEISEKSPPKNNQTINAATPMVKNAVPVNATPVTAKLPPGKVPQSTQQPTNGAPPPQIMPPFKTPIRPFPGASRTPVDRLIDYVVGDGPNNRYALICKRCHTHNGMALPEEFLTLSYKCFNCDFMNPSRRSEQSKFPQALSSSSETPVRSSMSIQNVALKNTIEEKDTAIPSGNNTDINEES
jgi:hypothetical protein